LFSYLFETTNVATYSYCCLITFVHQDEGECQSAEDEGIEQDSGEAEDSAMALAAAAAAASSASSNVGAATAAASASAAATVTSLSHVMDVSHRSFLLPFLLVYIIERTRVLAIFPFFSCYVT
jgi:hypothetical protein